MTGRRFDRALKGARLADNIRRSGIELGPLHGVPMTIRDAFELQGGCSARLDIQRLLKKYGIRMQSSSNV